MAIANLGNLEMKKVLLGTSALLGVGLMAGTAAASDGVKLSLGGFLRNYYGMTFDDDGSGEAGDNGNFDGVGTDAEIYFLGNVTLDNGVTVGARFDLEAGDENGDQFDQAFAYFSGNFGEIRIGSTYGAAANMYMLPPGSSANFGPYSPNTIGATVTSPGFFDPEGNLTGFNADQKIVYFSPTWSGFSFGVSYTPDDTTDNNYRNAGQNVDGTFHPTSDVGDARSNVGLGAHYAYEGEGWGLDVGGAAYWEGDVRDGGEGEGYNAGVNVSVGGFSFGVAGTFGELGGPDDEYWVIGAGMSYNVDAWTVGLGGAHLETDDLDPTTGNDKFTSNRIGVTGSYDMGPGIALDAGVFYSWVGDHSDDVNGDEDYDAIEFAIGSSITF